MIPHRCNSIILLREEPMRKKSLSEKETNSTAFNRIERLHLSCSICPPNRGENAKRKAKHGKTKPKYKDRFKK